MKRLWMFGLAALPAWISCAGCPHAPFPDVDDGVEALTLAPADATLTVSPGAHPTLAYVVAARHRSGRVEADVAAALSTSLPQTGSFSGGTFTASGNAGGVATITATYEGVSASTSLTLAFSNVVAGPGVSVDLAAQVATQVPSAAADDSLKPTLVYPYDGTIFPPNVYKVEWQWNAPSGADIYLITFENSATHIQYVSQTHRFILDAPVWEQLAGGNHGQSVDVKVCGSRVSNLTRAGCSSIRIHFGGEDLRGGLYYFTTNSDQSLQGVYRYDFGVPTPRATGFMTRSQAGACVGCHSLSRNGAQAAVTFEGGYGFMGVVNVATPRSFVFGGTSGPARAGFTAFFDDNRSVLGVYDHQGGNNADPNDPLNGQIVVHDVATGQRDASRQVPIGAGHRAAFPTMGPDGQTLVYVDYADTQSRPIHSEQGSIRVTRYDSTQRSWETPRTLVNYDGSLNNYYPDISPDGQWVILNRAAGDAYNNANARIFVTRLDGTGGVIELARANGSQSGVTNSWPRWAPFTSVGAGGRPQMWLCFSSMRDYGLVLQGQRRAQLWMVAFDPEAAARGEDPSAPPFWLPFQDMATQNHQPAWTEEIPPTQCQNDAECTDPALICVAGACIFPESG